MYYGNISSPSIKFYFSGVPFNENGSMQDYTKYMDAVKPKLDGATPDKFSIPLELLEQMIASIQMGAP
jgi:hypothetical protein